MSKIAFIFPGQGAQYNGMGKDFYDAYPVSKAVYDEATQLLDMDMATLCFEDNEQLHITEYTQVALLTTELAMLKVIEEKGIKADVTAGLSLGEYSALVAAGKISLEDALKVVRKRGIYMQEAVPSGGAMSAIIGLDNEKVEEICKGIDGIVELANYNCPGQIVISGEEKAVEEAGVALKEAGARMIAPLKVSGPFHSSMLTGAGEKLKAALTEVTLVDSDVPYVSNTTGDYVADLAAIKDLLVQQVSSSVRWEQGVRQMLANGVDTFIEIGPGKTLAGFMKRIDRKVKVINIEKIEDIEKLETL